MAAKKRKSSSGKMSKSDFVRSMPGSTPAKEVVDAAAKQGMKLDEKYVYNIRSADRQRGRAPGAPGRPARRGPAPRVGRAGGGGLEEQLRKIVAELGLARARDVFSQVEAAFGSR
jgi:hypothetical protein